MFSSLIHVLTKDVLLYHLRHCLQLFSEVIDNFNKIPNSTINNITPNYAFKEKNHITIYDINY